jgi:hypothetical protein
MESIAGHFIEKTNPANRKAQAKESTLLSSCILSGLHFNPEGRKHPPATWHSTENSEEPTESIYACILPNIWYSSFVEARQPSLMPGFGKPCSLKN